MGAKEPLLQCVDMYLKNFKNYFYSYWTVITLKEPIIVCRVNRYLHTFFAISDLLLLN